MYSACVTLQISWNFDSAKLHSSRDGLGAPSNVFFQLVLISWMVTPSSCLLWQTVTFILAPYEYGCAYVWTSLSGPAVDLQKMPNIIFSDEAHFDLRRVCKQAKLSTLEHKKHAHIYCKADTRKTSHCLVRILVQRSIWSIFLRKWARRGRFIFQK